jgi:hypothetical protein
MALRMAKDKVSVFKKDLRGQGFLDNRGGNLVKNK